MHCRAYHFAAFWYIMNGQITETGEKKCHTTTNIHTIIHTSIHIHMTTSMNTHMLMSTGMNIHTATSTTTESIRMTTATSIRRNTPKPF